MSRSTLISLLRSKRIEISVVVSFKNKFPAKALVAQRKNAKLLNAACSWRLFLCAFAPLRETISLMTTRRAKLCKL
jgi:hypothetical protein